MRFKSVFLAAALVALLSTGLPVPQSHAQSTTPAPSSPQDVTGTDPVPPPPGTTQDLPVTGTDPVPPPPGTTHMITSVPGTLVTLLYIL